MRATRDVPDPCVLVADGGAYSRRILREALARVGVRRVHEAVDGGGALDLLGRVRPDLMILDWNLGVLTGAELVRLVRRPASSPCPTLPMLLTLSEPLSSTVARAASLGVDAILAKPFAPRAVWDRLDALLNHPRPYVRSGGLLRPQPAQAADAPAVA